MMNLRSAGALLAISAALSCATAVNNDVPPGPSAMAGSDSGGGAGLEEAGGESAGGAPQAGAPGGAGKGGAGKGGSGSAGAGTGGNGSAGAGKGGSGGTVAVAGASGSNSGGKAGTSSSGAGGGSAASGGSAGVPGVAPCENAKDVTGGQSGNFNTTGAVCLRTKETFNTVGGCYGWDGRTIKVNGMLATCMVKATFPAAIDGWNYFDVTAGSNEFAGFSWFNG